jgi:hypothetical protein
VVAQDASLLAEHAAATGFSAVARLARVPDYYDTFFTDAYWQAALTQAGPNATASHLFEQLAAQSGARLSLADIAERWLAAAPPNALCLDAWNDGACARLDAARGVRAAIEVSFPSDLGAHALRAVLAAEREGAPLDMALRQRSPLLIAADICAAAGLRGAAPYLAELGANTFCFDPFVLTRPYAETLGQPMARVGLLLLDLQRGAA